MATATILQPHFVVRLDAITLSDPGSLTRLPIAVTGSWVKAGQKFTITPADFERIAANFSKLGTDGRAKDDVVVDYEHQSEFPIPMGPVTAAGWVKAIVPPAAGERMLYADVEFTDEARAMIAAKKYKYVSPAIVWSERDKRTGQPQGATLTSLALTNRPFLEELPALTLSDRDFRLVDVDQVHVESAMTDTPAASGKENAMKKLNVSRIKAGDKSGMLAMKHADFADGNDYFADPKDVKEALDDGGDDAVAMTERTAQTLSEITGVGGRQLDAQIAAVRDRFKRKVVLLTDVPLKKDGPDKGAPDFASWTPPADSLIASEVFEGREREALLQKAMDAKTILPKERSYLRRLTLSELRGYLEERGGRVTLDTRESGHASVDAVTSGAADAVFLEMDADCKQLLSDKKASSYGEALKLVSAAKPELRGRYDDLQRQKTRA